MILKMINQTQLSKDDRRKFIPFVNERNHMGAIIKSKQRDKQYFQSMEVFQNLKKTTKEYFFDKKYQKMKEKLGRCQRSLSPKEPNYDKEVSSCFRTLEKSSFFHTKYGDENNCGQGNLLFVDLNQRLKQNMSTLRAEISRKKQTKQQKTEKIKFKSIYNSENRKQSLKCQSHSSSRLRSRPVGYNQKQWNENDDNKNLRQKTIPSSRQQNSIYFKRVGNPVNRELFREISSQSEKMADFTNCGLKYKHLVRTEKKDPWKKWYVNSRVQIFPGETVDVKKLQKSIYD